MPLFRGLLPFTSGVTGGRGRTDGRGRALSVFPPYTPSAPSAPLRLRDATKSPNQLHIFATLSREEWWPHLVTDSTDTESAIAMRGMEGGRVPAREPHFIRPSSFETVTEKFVSLPYKFHVKRVEWDEMCGCCGHLKLTPLSSIFCVLLIVDTLQNVPN